MSDDTDVPKKLLDRFDTRAFIAIELSTSMVALTFVLALRAPETDAFKVLLGAMLTVGFASAIGWYFNSSSGSEKKDATQAKVAEKLAEKVSSTGTGNGQVADAMQAAAIVAPVAAAAAAPAAAAAAAPPAAEVAAPPAAREAVADFLKERTAESSATNPKEN